jgi:hypothetical protein
MMLKQSTISMSHCMRHGARGWKCQTRCCLRDVTGATLELMKGRHWGTPKLVIMTHERLICLSYCWTKTTGLHLLYPYWSNASDLIEMPESFYTIALHSEELHEALLQFKIPAGVNKKLSSELRHIARSMGVSFPFLPVHGIEEAKLFSTLVL